MAGRTNSPRPRPPAIAFEDLPEAEKLETFRYYTEPAARPRRPAPAIAFKDPPEDVQLEIFRYYTEPTAKGVIPELPGDYERPQRARARSTSQASRSSGPGLEARGQTAT